MKLLLRNPLTVWLQWLFETLILKIKFSGKRVRIGYMARAKNCQFGRNISLQDFVFLENVTIGDFSYVSARSQMANTIVGKFCSIGPNVLCGPGTHPADSFVSTHPAFYSTAGQTPVTFADKNYFQEHRTTSIGNDVWIGANTVIVDGVKIGDGAIIAAGAVVASDVPAYSVVGGVPAKLIRPRFDEKTVNSLIELKWWDKDEDWLRKNFRAFHDIKLVENLKNLPK